MKNKLIFTATIPVLVHYLENLVKIIDKGVSFSRQKKNRISEQKLIHARLAPDMFDLAQQIGYAYFVALEVATNLTGKETPTFTYDEKSAKELKASLSRVVKFLKALKPSDVAYSEKRKMKTYLVKKPVPRDEYIYMLALPNFFFHVTTAYDILRHLGVPLKKDDFLG